MNRWKLLFYGLGLLLFAVSSLSYAGAQTISQTYDADTTLQAGMIVGLKKSDATKVEAINNTRGEDVYGVVVTGNDTIISISSEDQKVYVAASGKNDVLVTDINGTIESGDYISVSSVSGFGMKSDAFQATVIGRALKGFSGSTDDSFLSQANIKEGSGKDLTINIGKIPVDIVIGKNPQSKAVDAPFVLRKIGELVAGEPVSGPKLYLALALIIIATGVSGAIIYSAVRSGLISIGRNPLSKKSINKSIFQMILVAFIVFFSAILGVYFILRI